MDIVKRVNRMILKPAEIWPVIEQEVTNWQKLYVPYMVALAAILAVAGFIGWSILGVGGFGMSLRVPKALAAAQEAKK